MQLQCNYNAIGGLTDLCIIQLMKCLFLKLVTLITVLFPILSFAADDLTPFALILVPGLETAGPDQTVYGFRATGFYGENKNVYGLDFGLFVNNTKDTFGGVALTGLVNVTGKQAYIPGFQAAGLANINRGKANVVGVQVAGLVNTIKETGGVYGAQVSALANIAPKTGIYGVQAGFYNRAQKIVGFQIGIINVTDTLHGFQIGLLNFCNHGTLLPVFPVLNIGF